MPRRKSVQKDGRKKFRKVESLQKWMRAYGRGSDGRREREGFAARLNTSLPYLIAVGCGFRKVSMELAVKIDRATYGQVSVEDLHPSDDWDYIAKRRKSAGGNAHA